MDNKINQEVFDKIFKEYSKEISIYLRSAKTKGANYDKFRNTGYNITLQNPISVLALTKSITPNSLIIRELGLTESGAIQIIISNDDVEALKICEKILIDNKEYTPWKKALGNKFQVFELPFDGFSKVILFRMDN